MWNQEYRWAQGIRNPKNELNSDPKFPRASRFPCLFLLLSCNIYVILSDVAQKSPKFGLFSQGISANQERRIFFSLWMTMLIIFFCFAAIEQTTCIQCFEVKDFGVFCKNTFSKVPCPSQNQCYTAKGHAKIFLRPDQFITTTVEGRGCANCKGKKVSATLIRPHPHPEKTMA